MGHIHQDKHGEVGNIKFAFFLNLVFAIIEIIGGILTNSIAIIADAVHDFGDALSLGMSWFFERYSHKSPNAKFHYGYRRFSLLGALINAMVLILGTIYVLTEIVARISEPAEVHSEGMFFLAILGIAVNGLAVFRMRQNTSLNSRMVMLHLMEDVLGWVAVLIASIIIYFTGWHFVDSWLSLIIAFWVLFNAAKGMIRVMKVLLQAAPSGFNYEEVIGELKKNEAIVDVHDLRVWSLDGERHIASLHVVLASDRNNNEAHIREQVRSVLETWNISHVTIQIETFIDADHCTM